MTSAPSRWKSLRRSRTRFRSRSRLAAMSVPARCRLGPRRSRPILGGGIPERKYEPIACTPLPPVSGDMCNLWALRDLTDRVETFHGGPDSVWMAGVLHPDSVNHPPIAIPPGGKLDEFNRSLRIGD